MSTRVIDVGEGRLAASAPLAEQAYAMMKQWLMDFEWMPGDRLSETDLSSRLQISRTPVRQALQRLQHEGFVDTVPRLGWMVAPLRFDRIDALYEFRTLIESDALRRLCERPSVLDDLAGEFEIWFRPDGERPTDAATVGRLDERFHRALVEAAGNEEILRTHQEITERIRIVRKLDFTQEQRVHATYAEHAAILDAIRRADTGQAQRQVLSHIEQSRRAVREITLDRLYRARPDRRP